ncbi:hypothetical protein [Streptomyces sp. NPDC006971]|uniref:hypothetical protein n=1 Tax=Streptomyces sp. NPDC006971 TaxID=3154784 RepID=UPI0033C62370
MDFARRTVEIARRNVEEGGRPFATFYGEFAKEYRDRRLPTRHEPHEAAVDVYRFRQDRNGGDRRVVAAPTAR